MKPRHPDAEIAETEYVPCFDKQLQVIFAEPASTTLMNGGVGFGKTRTLAQFLLDECYSYPDGQLLVGGATMPAMEKALIPKVHEEFDARGIWYDYTDYRKEVRFSNGTWYKYQTMEVPTKELEGSELSALAIDEISACPEAQVESLLNRVRRQSSVAMKYNMALKFNLPTDLMTKPGDPDWWDFSRRILLCGNPPEAGHWLEARFRPKDGEPIGTIISASTYENLLLPDDYIKKLERRFKPGTYMHKRMVLGEFGLPPEGAIYDGFDVSVHLVDNHELPLNDLVMWQSGLDLGHGDPFVYMTGFVTKNNHIYVTGEYFSKPRLLKQHAAAIRRYYRGGPIWSDYGGQERAELAALGIKTFPANKDLLMGIHAVRNRFAEGTLHLLRGATPNLIREMSTYTWGQGDKPNKGKEGDHALDALRYLVAGVDLPRERK